MATTYEIHPAIGVARVGTSAASFVGPEPGLPAPAAYRDAKGNLLRQAARFRVFRCTRAPDGTLRTATHVTAADAKPARVIVAPPDFAPGIVNLITLYDVAFQAAVDRGWRSLPAKPSFARDVQPILLRVLGYQWVLQLARNGHAPGTGMGDFASLWLALGDPSPAHAGARQGVLATLRDPQDAATDDDFGFMPRLHHSDYAAFPNAVLRLTPTQYAVLQRWVDGHFVKDLDRPKAEIGRASC